MQEQEEKSFLIDFDMDFYELPPEVRSDEVSMKAPCLFIPLAWIQSGMTHNVSPNMKGAYDFLLDILKTDVLLYENLSVHRTKDQLSYAAIIGPLAQFDHGYLVIMSKETEVDAEGVATYEMTFALLKDLKDPSGKDTVGTRAIYKFIKMRKPNSNSDLRLTHEYLMGFLHMVFKVIDQNAPTIVNE